MNFRQNIQIFEFVMGVLLISEGILGVLLFNIYGTYMDYLGIYGYLLVGIMIPFAGIILLNLSIILPEVLISIRYSLPYWIFIITSLASLSAGYLLNNLCFYYLSGLFLSWACASFIWNLVIGKKISNKFEPELEIVEYPEIQEEEISRKIKTAGIDPIGHLQMMIDRIAYLDPVYARKKSRWWLWNAKGRVILTDKELIFLSVKKKNINFLIPISQIETIQLFQTEQRGYFYKTCEIIYGNPKTSAIFMTYFINLDKYNIKLQETFQKWYETWHE